MTLDISADFASVVDGLEAVTLAVRGGDSQAITHAHRNQHRRREADPAGGQAVAAVTTWQWPMSESDRPPLGSVIVDAAGERYTIVGLAEQVLASKYSADCRRLSVEAGIDTWINLARAGYAKNTSGEAVATWQPVATGLRAKVQPVAHVAEAEHEADETQQQYAVILERDLPTEIDVAGVDLRVTDVRGGTYRVLRYEQPERIDVLPRLVCAKE